MVAHLTTDRGGVGAAVVRFPREHRPALKVVGCGPAVVRGSRRHVGTRLAELLIAVGYRAWPSVVPPVGRAQS